jgi:hypothetical protein
MNNHSPDDTANTAEIKLTTLNLTGIAGRLRLIDSNRGVTGCGLWSQVNFTLQLVIVRKM